MAAEGRRGGHRNASPRRSPPPREREDRRGPPQEQSRDRSRDRSPDRNPERTQDSRERSPPRGPQFRRDDPYRDPYRDPYDEGFRHPPPPSRDPFMNPYRRDPYGDPYGMPPGPPPLGPPPPFRMGVQQPPFECNIITIGPIEATESYAETVERRLRGMTMMTNIQAIATEAELAKAIEEASRRHVPYVAVIRQQNTVHRSITINVLHGTPQEHRNMPLDDAMILVKRNFDNYIAEMREKANRLPPAAALPAVAPIPTDYLPPDKHTHYLLNLLADGRVLTLEELDRVLGYLEDRRVKMLAKTAGPPRRPPDAGMPPVAARPGPPGPPPGPQPGRNIRDEANIDRQQAVIENRIRGMLNGNEAHQPTSGAAQSLVRPSLGPPMARVNPAPSLQPMRVPAPAPAPTPAPPPPISKASTELGGLGSINFDSPSVQRALDNLIQSGPNLLASISAITSTSGATSVSASTVGQMIPPQRYLETPPAPRPRAPIAGFPYGGQF